MFQRVLLYSALMLTAAGISGCAPIACGTNQCGCAIDSVLGCGPSYDCCGGGGDNCCDCGDGVCCGPGGRCCGIRGRLAGCTCGGLGRCGICQAHARLLALKHQHCMIAVGPPAVKFQPQMPPEFLPVPTQPIMANVNTCAPVEMRGSVDAGWGRYFMVEPHD